jgi:L-lactate dehydrogenase complex protein LldG
VSGSARDEILARVRTAQANGTGTADDTSTGTGTGTPTASAAGATPRDYRHADTRPRDELVALFCERVGDYRAEVRRVAADQLRDAIGAAAARHHARRLAIPARLPDAWRPHELELIPDAALTARALDAHDGVITGCSAAIAETGTIALTAAPHEGRRILSLVPDLHICVVDSRQILGSVPEAITQLAAITQSERRPITLISGPSATSDIELQRVEGVHGPRKLVVLVIEQPA